MTVARAAHTATLLPSGKVLIAGGMVGNGSFLGSAELYDPSTGTFSATASMHTARVGHQAVLLPGGRVLVIGGGCAANRTLAEIYDESRAQWQDAGFIPGDLMVVLNDGTVLISGARDSAPGFRSTDTYDPTTGIITPAGRITPPAFDVQAARAERFAAFRATSISRVSPNCSPRPLGASVMPSDGGRAGPRSVRAPGS